MAEDSYDINLLKPWIDQLPDPQKFWDYYKDILKLGEENKINISGSQFGYIQDNIEIAKKIPEKYIVIDAGCGLGWQQVLYQKHKKYIGINYFFDGHNITAGTEIELKPVFPTAYFYQGLFHEVIGKVMEEHNLKFDDDDIFAITHISFFDSSHSSPEALKSREKFLQFKNHYIEDRKP